MFKDFCYFDKNNGDYVQLNCSLKEGISEADIKGFYDKLYAIKLDSTYSRTSDFGSDNNTGDLRRCFLNMIGDEVLSFEGIYNLFDTEEQRKSPRLSLVINEFMGMFTFEESQRFTAKEFGAMIRMADSSMFGESSPVFERELRSSQYNTQMMSLIDYTPVIEQKEKKLIHK